VVIDFVLAEQWSIRFEKKKRRQEYDATFIVAGRSCIILLGVCTMGIHCPCGGSAGVEMADEIAAAESVDAAAAADAEAAAEGPEPGILLVILANGIHLGKVRRLVERGGPILASQETFMRRSHI
jgi:hypothetical protein